METLFPSRPAIDLSTHLYYQVVRIEANVSECGTNSHNAAFETWMSEQPWNWGPEERVIRFCARVCAAMAGSHLAGRDLPANGRESPGRAG
jgi:hypothetical protein